MTLAREGHLITAAALALAVFFVLAGTWLGGIVGVLLLGIGIAPLGPISWFLLDPQHSPRETALATRPTGEGLGEAPADALRRSELGGANA